jgi:hypothetical protein
MAIGFYNRGPISLPHPPYPKATLRVIENAIREAWRIIRDHPALGFEIDNAEENRITRVSSVVAGRRRAAMLSSLVKNRYGFPAPAPNYQASRENPTQVSAAHPGATSRGFSSCPRRSRLL